MVPEGNPLIDKACITENTTIPCTGMALVWLGSRGKSQPLQDLSMSIILAEQRRQKPVKTSLSCKLCAMFICKSIRCWSEHLEACITSN